MFKYESHAMLRHILALSAFLFFIGFTQASLAEVYKWVDANGKVHFGASVPAEYAAQAEVVDVTPTNTIAPEPEVKQQNKRAVNELKRQDAKKKKQQKDIQRQAKQKHDQGEGENLSVQEAIERCRDTYPTVKKRTECFKRAAGQ